MAKDYYDILGVSHDASDEDIKRAFRRLAHQHHPDKGGGDETKFKEVNEAYQVLGNKEKRSQYDQFGSAFQGAGAGAGPGGFRWSDFQQAGGFGNGGFQTEFDLGDMFGDVFGFGGRQRRQREEVGRDIEMRMEVSFEDAAFGVTKAVEFSRMSACSRCKGNGAEPDKGIKTCTTCNGAGQVERMQQTILGGFRSVATCPTCNGRGAVAKEKCTKCKGDGRIRENKRLDIRVPAGISDGQTIRLSGEGEAGEHGAGSGDLFVHIRVAPHETFKRDGSDILSDADISFSQAALGGKIDVATLDGGVVLKIPAGTQSGRTFRIKGKGAHRLRSTNRGDHLLTVHVKTPEKLSKNARKLLEELGEES